MHAGIIVCYTQLHVEYSFMKTHVLQQLQNDISSYRNVSWPIKICSKRVGLGQQSYDGLMLS